jgi:3-acetyloctanal synthase
MDITIAVLVVTRSPEFFETGLSVLGDVRTDIFHEVSIDADMPYSVVASVPHPVYDEAKRKAVAFLGTRKDRLSIRILQAPSLERAAEKIIASRGEGGGEVQVGMVYLDCTDGAEGQVDAAAIDEGLAAFYRRMQAASVPAFCSPTSVAAFMPESRGRIRYQPESFIECRLPSERAILQTELLCLWMDFFEMSYANRRIKPAPKPAPRSVLGRQLVEFLSRRAGSDWLGFYFTGSMVSNIITCFEEEARRRGALILRGPNEHSLACGAMANWQLYKKPFVIIVTSGMIDEFKGTLANLREARAKGFIICAENRASQWFAFQGTVSADEDTRDVLGARRLPYVYMDDAGKLPEYLRQATELYDAEEGPVVLLATQAVLDASADIEFDFPGTPNAPHVPASAGSGDAELEKALDLLNRGPDKVVWQCGPLDEDELELTLSIADRAGIALVDSLTYPGSVPKFHRGGAVPQFLGTLGVYGYSARVYNYLHTNDRLNPVEDQCLFFIKSKLAQVATPFSEGRLRRNLQIVQLTERADHVAPFTDVPLVMNCRDFLQRVDAGLEVPPDLRARRLAGITAVPDSPSDVISRLPNTPMSPNYFFASLNGLVERLIVERGYDYTGMYDVGRCGISAIRNVARTRRGFSGWYGRALMGDALLATALVAHTSPTNVLAFIGDGAKGIVPDVLPSLAENFVTHAGLDRKNITILYFMNGGYSVIKTYQERILFNRSSRQMRIVNLRQNDWSESLCGVDVLHRTIDMFDEAMFEEALLAPNRINIFSVNLAHNNEGDGLSLATATGWQRDASVFHQAV